MGWSSSELIIKNEELCVVIKLFKSILVVNS